MYVFGKHVALFYCMVCFASRVSLEAYHLCMHDVPHLQLLA